MVDKSVIDTLIAEAYAEGPEGMRRVAETIINRAALRGLTLDQVVRQPRQYTGYSNPGSDAKRAQQSPKARAAAEAALNLALQPGDPTGGADHYLNPRLASPAWASKIPSTGTYGNHQFFASRPIPPGELPSVATLTDTVPSRPVAPVTPSIDLAQMRRSTAPTGLVEDSFAAIPGSSATANLGDRIGMSPIQGGKQTAPTFDAAYDTRTGTMRMLEQPETVSSQGLGIGASPEPVAMPRPRPPTVPADLIGQSMTRIASANPTLLPPVPPSQLGRPGTSPSTRSVTSVPVPASQSLPPLSRSAIPQSFAGMDRAVGRPVPPPNVAQPAGSIVPNKGQERLAPGVLNNGDPVIGGSVDYAAARMPGMPRPLNERPMAPTVTANIAPVPAPPYRNVATQLSVTPPRVAPVPFTRPDFGMGGVDIIPVVQSARPVAPAPMPRLDRPGVFGNPQILGHDIKLPGALGFIQDVTKRMANSSGPFNNGVDNLLYNTMRGGDFNTPGAATRQAGGYLYAPKAGGGWVNVGRAPNFNRVGNGNTGVGAGSGSTSSGVGMGGSGAGGSLRRGDRSYNSDTNSWELK